MTSRVLLGIGQEELRTQTMATFAELGDDVDMLGVAENSSDLLMAVEATEDLDIVVVDDQIGSLPYLSVIRDIVSRAPDVAVLVMTSEPSVSMFQSVMDAGARAVIDAPPALDELQARLPGIVDWQRKLRSQMGGGLALGSEHSGRLIVFTGAKGGVGTSTVALHTALLAAVSNPERRICLVDLDLQQRGIRQLFDLTARRTIADLVTISDALTGRNLDEAVIVHRSGLRVLMAPKDGEQSDDISGPVARQIIGAAKGHYDLIIADAGSVVTEASAVAMEFADNLIMVATPDVSCIRAAQDKVDMLDRLQVAKPGDVHLLFNKVSPRNEVQPEFGARMTSAEPTATNFPDDWRRLEAASNAMSPLELEDGPFRRAVVALGRELRLALGAVQAPDAPIGVSAPDLTKKAAPEKKKRGRSRKRKGGDDRGQVTIEALMGIVVAMLIAVFLIQTALLAIATVSSRRAADEAARIGTRGGTLSEAQQAAKDATPFFYDVDVSQVDDDTYQARLTAPVIVPWVDHEVTAQGSASDEE
ncbi:AAA family ATPase [Nocardioides speluncae]|uniref:AAA family ATPase n=1 Tax=Nocardioides speluncae TaxID=2670337 RepID=UPI000D698B3A|nr:AAA family ATPase [Nocardioides speluncae]